MKQQINLHQLQRRSGVQPLSAPRLAQTLLGVLVLMVLVSVWLHWDQRQQRQSLEALEQQRSEHQQEIARLQVQFPPPKEDPALAARLARMEQDLAAKQQFIAGFSAGSLGNSEGFAPVMAGLAKRPTPGLWLSSFSVFGDGGLAFSGGATDPKAVPAFVAQLGQEPVFAGREFRTLRIERSRADPRYLDFSLRTAGEAR
jgi:cell division protein FtsL